MNIGKRAKYFLGNNCSILLVSVLFYWYTAIYLSVYICTCRLVEETLAPLDEKRRAFRLVGGILVERTVGEVLPSVITNRNNLEHLIESLSSKLQQRQKESSDLKKKYNLQTPEEQEAMLRRRQQK